MSEARILSRHNLAAIGASAVAVLGANALHTSVALASPAAGGAPIEQPSNPSGGAGVGSENNPKPTKNKSVLKMGRTTIDAVAADMYYLKPRNSCKEYRPTVTNEGATSVISLCESKPDQSGSNDGIVMMDAVTKNRPDGQPYSEPYEHAINVEVSEGKFIHGGEYLPENTDLLEESRNGITAVTQTGHFNTNKYVTYSASTDPHKGEFALSSSNIDFTGLQMNKFMFRLPVTGYFKTAFTEPRTSNYPLS